MMASFSDVHGGYCTCTRDKCSDDCRTYRRYKPKPITNADRIRAMTDEELAEWIISTTEDDTVGWLDWLKQEAMTNGN